MDQTIGMLFEQHLSNILKQISESKNYAQVEALIVRLAEPRIHAPFQRHKCMKALEAKIETLSPLPLNSTQWSFFRYALICLRNISKEKDDQPFKKL